MKYKHLLWILLILGSGYGFCDKVVYHYYFLRDFGGIDLKKFRTEIEASLKSEGVAIEFTKNRYDGWIEGGVKVEEFIVFVKEGMKSDFLYIFQFDKVSNRTLCYWSLYNSENKKLMRSGTEDISKNEFVGLVGQIQNERGNFRQTLEGIETVKRTSAQEEENKLAVERTNFVPSVALDRADFYGFKGSPLLPNPHFYGRYTDSGGIVPGYIAAALFSILGSVIIATTPRITFDGYTTVERHRSMLRSISSVRLIYSLPFTRRSSSG